MTEIKFIIPVKPLPYKNLTRDDRYLSGLSKSEVGHALMPKYTALRAYQLYRKTIERISLQHDYPRSPTKKTHMHINLYFTDKRHGNPVNYWQCIASSAFKSHKMVVGGFDLFIDDEARAEVIITHEGAAAVPEKEDKPETLAGLLDLAL